MNASTPDDEQTAKNLYTIGTVSELTGVPAITLRAWERRYQLIRPVRKASGHRLYTRHQIDLINRITALTAKGIRISQIRPEMLRPESGDDSDATGASPWSGHVEEMVSAIITFDEARLETIYNDLLSLHPIELVTRQVLTPLLTELGRRWESGEGNVAEEHFFAFYLRNKLGARYHHRAPRGRGTRLLITSMPGDLHELGLLIFALAAHDSGYRVLNLGPSMPLDELPAVLAKSPCDAIVLSGSGATRPASIAEPLKALTSAVEVPVFVGGEFSVVHCDTVTRAGARALGKNMDHGLQQLHKLMESTPDT
jgi:DNA-binding transcriptional MerR regulator/methylmalonyl-CoA mutase cobalamin-binding subunit